MSEIQLISPAGSDSAISIRNATRFKKFFDDDIVIEPNSKIYLNHAIFSKHESVVFSQDETFTLTIEQDNVYGNLSAGLVLSFTVPEGVHTYSELKTKIKDGIAGIIANTTNGGTFNAYESLDKSNPEDDLPYLGFYPKTSISRSTATDFGVAPIKIGVAHSAFPLNIVNQNVASNANFVSFYMASKPYFHGQVYTQEDIFERIITRAVDFNLVKGNTNLTIATILADEGAISPKISFGLYGKEYATDDTVGTGTRTNAGAITLVQDFADATLTFPTMFLQWVVDVREDDLGAKKVFLNLYLARSTAQGSIPNWQQQQEEINTVKNILSVNLSESENIGENDHLDFRFFTYQYQPQVGFRTSPETFFGLRFVGGRDILIFDSREVGISLQDGFFMDLDDTDIRRRSQRPFYPCVSTNFNTYGGKIKWNSLSDDDTVIVRRMDYSASLELSKAIGLKDGTTTIFPNPANSSQLIPRVAIPATFEDYYRMESYAIRLNNIPIQAYKTNETKGNRGYKQNILAVVPTPFQQADRESRVNIDGQDYLSSTYNAYYPMPKDMKNQRLVVNHFDVEVIRLSDDTQALDLNQVALNFSILPPS